MNSRSLFALRHRDRMVARLLACSDFVMHALLNPAFVSELEALRRRVEIRARAVDSMLARSARPGMLIVVSDYLDAGPVTAALSRAKSSGHDLALLQVLSPDEMEPSFEGDWTLEDAETGAVVDVTMDGAALEAYMLRLTGLCEELRAFARKHGATYVRLRTDEDLEAVIRRFVAPAID